MNETNKDKNLVLLKVQKLSTALYLVSSFLPDQDPLKWRLRNLSLLALEQGQTNAHDALVETISQLLVLIDLTLMLPAVSQMNFSILRQEYQQLQQELTVLNHTRLSFDWLNGAPLASASAPDSRALAPTTGRPLTGSNERQSAILKYLKQSGWSPIKDIAKLLPAVSSKTVQRELAELVQAGRLRREGIRRWSRYALVDADR